MAIMTEPELRREPRYQPVFRLDVATLPWSDPVRQYPGKGDEDKGGKPYREISTVEQSVTINEQSYTVIIQRVETKNYKYQLTGLTFVV